MSLENIRKKILGKSKREKFMLLALIAGVVISWGFFLLSSFSQINQEISSYSLELNENKILVSKKPKIEARLKEIKESLQFEGSMNESALMQKLEETFAECKTSSLWSIEAPKTKELSACKILEISASCKGASLSNLIDFTNAIDEKFPILRLDTFTITKEKSDPEKLSARFTVQSFELK